MRPSRRLLLAFRIGLVLGPLVAADAFLIEPYRIEVTRHHVEGPFDPPLKVAHLTDLHTRGPGRRERRMLAVLAEEKPDLIVVTGDIRSGLGTAEGAIQVLERLRAPLGVWAVRGNWDVYSSPETERRFYQESGVRFLLNQGAEARPGLWIMGFDDEPFGSTRIFPTLSHAPRRDYRLALFHFPVYFDDVAGLCDLALSGHTHGGQVRLPLLPPLWIPDGGGSYVEGWYEKRGSRMYVGRGLGMSFLPIRFLCRPEVAFFTIGKPPGGK